MRTDRAAYDATVFAINEQISKQPISSQIHSRYEFKYDHNSPIYYNKEARFFKNIDASKLPIKITVSSHDLSSDEEYKKFITNKNTNYYNCNLYNEKKDLSSLFIPQFIKINDIKYHRGRSSRSNIKYSNMCEASHTFSHIIYGLFSSTDCMVNIQGSIVRGAIFPLSDCMYSAVYVNVVNNLVVSIYPAFNYVISTTYNSHNRNNAIYPLSIHDLLISLDRVPEAKSRFHYTKKDVINLINSTKKPYFGSAFHENIISSDLELILSDENMLILNHLNLNHIAELGKAYLIGVIIWYLSVDPVYRNIISHYKLFDTANLKEFDTKAKMISEKAKFLQNLIPIDLKPLFEINAIVNRVACGIDWKKEKNHREKPNIAKIPFDYVYTEAIKILHNEKTFRPGKYKSSTWKDFWDTRYEWAQAGAVYSQYDEDESYKDKKVCFRNKLVLINTMPNEIELNYFVNRNPEISAKTSIKYEWGKERAIYGADLTSTILFQFAMGECENLLDPRFTIGARSRPRNVSCLLNSMLNHTTPLCLDYEDFNSQHSTSSMKAVLAAFHKVFSPYMTKEQKLAMHWCYDSINKQIVVDNVGLNMTYQTNGTLFSGWRLTSFMNSILNGIYFNYINEDVIPYDRHAHSGDDSIIGVLQVKEYTNLLINARKCNIRLSKGKSHFGSVAEFLRVDHCSDKTGQYLPRAIASFVYARIESDPAYDIADVMNSYVERSASCINRGASHAIISAIAAEAMIRHSTTMTGYRITPELLLMTPRVCGGLSDSRILRYSHDIIKRGLWESLLSQSDRELNIPDKKLVGCSAYANWLKRRFPEFPVSSANISKKLGDTLISTFAKVKGYYTIRDLNTDEQRKKKILVAIKGAHTKSISYIDYGRAKIVGALIHVIKNSLEARVLAEVVRGEPDPIRTLQLII